MIELPALGMGCAGIGNLYRVVEDAVAVDTVAHALARGIRFFDVAPHYGFGLAECRLGDALAECDPQGEAIVSTKVGRVLEPTDSVARERHGFVQARPYGPHFDYTGDAILRSHAESLERLKRDRLNLLLAHDLGALTHGAASDGHLRTFLDSGYAAMTRLRDEGAVDAIGVGVNEIAICLALLDEVPLDVILLAGRYTLLEPETAAPLLERCAVTGTRLIVGGPFNSGILIDGSARAEQSHYDYAPPPRWVIERVRTLEALCESHGISLGAAALQFCARAAPIASTIPGLVGRDQVDATIAFQEEPIPDRFWDAVRASNACSEISAA
ncbi:aldo/keto reductase [Stakelama saccharophila]|uniref:Aldo/keto reductase n=1 Tax=Stakelama saccharophila TaxID=3075605 RepID=A0ABZ0B612_9SPHN|nr:aldo/keto reductase [Stakelama sp. W311]WNO52837.1 aldo/keto reductase [Stakelama sp. W311]